MQNEPEPRNYYAIQTRVNEYVEVYLYYTQTRNTYYRL